MLLWVLLCCPIVALLVLLVVALDVYWRVLQRRQDDDTSTSPVSNSDSDSNSNSKRSSGSDSELPSSVSNSSEAETGKQSSTINNEKMYAPSLPRTRTRNSCFAATGAVDTSHEYCMSSEEQTESAVYELPVSSAPSQSVTTLQTVWPIRAYTSLRFILADNKEPSHDQNSETTRVCTREPHLRVLSVMGSAPCRNEGHWPPKFSFGRPTMILAVPKIWEVYNNSNLVNNEVFKKLTTKLASMKYYGNLVWYHLLNLLTQLLDFLLYMITEYSQ